MVSIYNINNVIKEPPQPVSYCDTSLMLILCGYHKMENLCIPNSLFGSIPSLCHIGTRVIIPRYDCLDGI